MWTQQINRSWHIILHCYTANVCKWLIMHSNLFNSIDRHNIALNSMTSLLECLLPHTILIAPMHTHPWPHPSCIHKCHHAHRLPMPTFPPASISIPVLQHPIDWFLWISPPIMPMPKLPVTKIINLENKCQFTCAHCNAGTSINSYSP